MKIPLWKIWLSYFLNFRLEKSKSKYSGSLEIILNRGRLALCTDNAMYSYEDLYVNFRVAFEKIDIKNVNTENVLLLGAGLLSVPYILEKIHHKKFRCKAVDIDPEVLRLASKYALHKIESDMVLICSDAIDFVNREQEKYGLIIVDIFIDDKVPAEFESIKFLEDLKNLMSDNSLLLFNRLAQNDDSLKKTENYYERVFKKVFNRSEMLNVKANRMLIARL